nr:hypothetical protein [Streptococcus uberis]
MKKKFLTVLLFMAVLTLVGCSKSSNTKKETKYYDQVFITAYKTV